MRILLIADADGNHLSMFLRKYFQRGNDAIIDVLSYKGFDNHSLPSNIRNRYTIGRHFPPFIYIIPKIQSFIRCLDFRKTLSEIPDKYDLINIHYVGFENALSVSILKKKSRKLILTPYGSDVLRLSVFKRKLIKRLYDNADIITGRRISFTEVVKQKFSIDSSKIFEAGIGSDMIDIIRKSTLTREQAKSNIGLKGRFIITIGYNRSSAQHHIDVIDSLLRIRRQLPVNITVCLPMTYPKSDADYIDYINSYLDNASIDYKIFNHFLSESELLYIRKASDVFIHAQSTDADNSSMIEYMLAGNTIINGSWLRYSQLERFYVPYYMFDTFKELDNCVIKAIKGIDPPQVTDLLYKEICDNGWDAQIQKWEKLYKSI